MNPVLIKLSESSKRRGISITLSMSVSKDSISPPTGKSPRHVLVPILRLWRLVSAIITYELILSTALNGIAGRIIHKLYVVVNIILATS